LVSRRTKKNTIAPYVFLPPAVNIVLDLEIAMSDRVRGARALLPEGEIDRRGTGASTLPALQKQLKATGRRVRLQAASEVGEGDAEPAEAVGGRPKEPESGPGARDRVSTLPAKAGGKRPLPRAAEPKPVEEASGIRARVPRQGEYFPQPQPVPVDLLRYLSYAPSVAPKRAPSAPNNTVVAAVPAPVSSSAFIDSRAVPVVRVVRAILRKLDLTPNELFLLESCNGVSTVGDLVDIGIVPAGRIDAMLRRLIAANIVQLRMPRLTSMAAQPSRDEDELAEPPVRGQCGVVWVPAGWPWSGSPLLLVHHARVGPRTTPESSR
jgi:hypothetical protein